MTAYIAMLRGINVSGQKIVRMEQLRETCKRLGLQKLETYVQSGNLVFSSVSTSPSALSKKISQGILRDFGFSVPVLIKTAEELDGVVKRNPFPKEKDIDTSRLHVTFLSAAPAKDALENLSKLPKRSDRFHVGREEIYLHCPDGYGETKLSNVALEKALSVAATTRNWKTVNVLLEMASRL